MITKQQALEAANIICEMGNVTILPKNLVEDPWLACEQQMVARIIQARDGNDKCNAKAWEAGDTLRKYFYQEGQLIKRQI